MANYLIKLFQYLWKDISEVMVYLPAGTMIFIVACICGAAVVRIRRCSRSIGLWRGFSLALLAAYCVVVFFITFLSREPGARNGLDLMPFATMGNSIQGDAYVLENVLLFIPLGFLLPASFRWIRRSLRCAGTGLAISLLIEGSQFITSRGYVQTDDVLTNTLGMVIGYAVFWLCTRLRA